MGIVLERFEKRKGRPRKYDWDTLADGRPRQLTHGEDFDATLYSFRTMLHRKAKELDMRVATRIIPEDDAIQFQFSKR
jgi:hypothetical protein